ncbi:serine hydrolase domain-containing protein [Phytomonospora endophytica]|uniref:CubicO group peptidase (Beta-lactamase class C family) n=1 Tax=Phytomonospora endophytica TaxID=714109 RepID=A0A841FJT3_9ACTN|nr:serine hydrolase domain-containing protein [Phytomonospora endophytica]MBB6033822.1 CubicO group peptidase (beta-lactamase class C family) [Phytomonospora endophytica]GIG64659.1 serine hydrolase [Phytomonospora endophytica]
MSSQGVLDGTARRFERVVAEAQSVGRMPSLVAGVSRGGGLAWSGARGRVEGVVPDVGTQYRIGSLTKTMVAVLVMRLRDEGLVDLSDSLDKHVPGSAVGDRTVGQLLAHTGGVVAELPGSWWERVPGVDREEMHERLSADPVVSRAGGGFHYSNPGYALLGELVERVRGAGWWEVLGAELLGPLGMSRTVLEPSGAFARGFAVHPWADVVLTEAVQDLGAMGPAGQLWSTVADLSRWAVFLSGDTGGVLSGDTLAEMCEPVGVSDGDAWTGGYGLGVQLWRSGGRRLVGHGGSVPGYLAGIVVDREWSSGAVALMNCTSSEKSGVAASLLSALGELEPPMPGEWSPEVGVDPGLLEVVGPWYWGAAPSGVRLLREGWLELFSLGRSGGRGARFRPNGDGTWTGLDGYYTGEVLRVVRDGVGVVSHLDVGTFVYTREPYGPAGVVPGGVDSAGWV